MELEDNEYLFLRRIKVGGLDKEAVEMGLILRSLIGYIRKYEVEGNCLP